MMRAVAQGDVVTWGKGAHGYRVVKIDQLGLWVDGEYAGHSVFFVPWSGNGDHGGHLRFLCGDRIDVIASHANRYS